MFFSSDLKKFIYFCFCCSVCVLLSLAFIPHAVNKWSNTTFKSIKSQIWIAPTAYLSVSVTHTHTHWSVVSLIRRSMTDVDTWHERAAVQMKPRNHHNLNVIAFMQTDVLINADTPTIFKMNVNTSEKTNRL